MKALPRKERDYLIAAKVGLLYRKIIKPLLFRADAETVHRHMTHFGQLLGKIELAKRILKYYLKYESPMLAQEIAGMKFENPVGLAAGFDYEARLTQVLPNVGFGYETVGTITHRAYIGNPKPMLGRLPKSKSLMVNKGFKNLGAKKTILKLENYNFDFPLGVSIGRTNNIKIATQKNSIEDIGMSFLAFENSNIQHSYYELNISCPNLKGNVSFYPPKNLNSLLLQLDKIHLTRPLFIKMPIEKNNKEVMQMLEVISKHKVDGVIFGNLQKDRKNTLLDPSELKKYPVGNFSGKPTFKRSNELIELTYKYYGKRLIVIGCGGIFNAEDAYTKIKLGASLVQLITGMIFQGPQLASEINRELVELLKTDGYSHISEAIGKENLPLLFLDR